MARPDGESGEYSGFELLSAFIAARGASCPVCGYSLRGLASARCPECGVPLELQVGSPQLRVGGWALAMIAFALALGFDGVVSLLMVWQILVTSVSRGSVQWDVFGVATLFLVLSLCMLGGLTWVARSRTAWQRRAVQAQWVLGGAWFGAVGVLHAVVGVGIAAVFII